MKILPLRLGLMLATTLAAAPMLGWCDGPRLEGEEDRSHHRDWSDEDRTHDRARRARERGEILPIAEIFVHARAQFPGRVLEAELEREHGQWVYELKILDARGRLFEIYMDARTGDVLEYEGED